MNEKQLLKLSTDIYQSGLSENKIAQELLEEINEYIKSSSMQRKAYFADDVGNPSLYRDGFTYWSLAALSKLKEQGAVDLLTIDIPQPQKGESIFKYVQRVSGQGEGRRRLLRRPGRTQEPPASEGSNLKSILDAIWSAGKDTFNSQFKKVPKAFNNAYRNNSEMIQYAVKGSGDWAFAVRGHNMAHTEIRESARVKVWDSVQEATNDTGNLVSDVIGAINNGVWKKVYNPLSWKKSTAPVYSLDDTNTGDDSDIDRYNTKEVSTPSFENEVVDQMDAEREKHEEVIEKIIDQTGMSWYEAEDYAKEMAEKAKEVSEQMAQPVTQVDDPEVKESMEAIRALNLEINALREMSELLNDGKFHWLFDSHIYLTQWPDFYHNFDAEAMTKLDALVKQSGQTNLVIALKALVNINSVGRLKALTHFIENCMDKSLLKSILKGKPGVSYLMWLCIRAKGSFNFTAQGREKTILADTSAFPSGRFWSAVRNDLQGITDEEQQTFLNDMMSMLKELAPMTLVTEKTTEKTIKYLFKIANKDKRTKDDIKDLVKGTTGYYDGPKGLFYSIVASEVIRYRYYMDLGMADMSSNPLVPSSLGQPACDNAVRLLIPQMPEQILNTIKKKVVMGELEGWGETVADALETQAVESEKLKKALSANTKKLIEALKAKDTGSAKQARLRIARLVRNR